MPVVVCLTLFMSRETVAWIGLGLNLAVGTTNAVFLGRHIARWRAKRAKVPDGPEADYVEPAA